MLEVDPNINKNFEVDQSAAVTAKDLVISDRPWLIAVVGFLSVIICCVISQFIASSAKKSKLKMNRYLMKKQQEKDELIQHISME